MPSFWMFMNRGTMLMVVGMRRESMTRRFTAPWPRGLRMPRP